MIKRLRPNMTGAQSNIGNIIISKIKCSVHGLIKIITFQFSCVLDKVHETMKCCCLSVRSHYRVIFCREAFSIQIRLAFEAVGMLMQMSCNICPLIYSKHKIQTTHNLEQMKYLGTLLEGCLNCAGSEAGINFDILWFCVFGSLSIYLLSLKRSFENTLLRLWRTD